MAIDFKCGGSAFRVVYAQLDSSSSTARHTKDFLPSKRITRFIPSFQSKSKVETVESQYFRLSAFSTFDFDYLNTLFQKLLSIPRLRISSNSCLAFGADLVLGKRSLTSSKYTSAAR